MAVVSPKELIITITAKGKDEAAAANFTEHQVGG